MSRQVTYGSKYLTEMLFSASPSYFEELDLTKAFEEEIVKKDPQYLSHVGLFSAIADQLLSNFDSMPVWNGDNLGTIGFTEQGATKVDAYILNGISHFSPRCSLLEYLELHHSVPVPLSAATFPVNDEVRNSSFDQSFPDSSIPDKKVSVINLTGRQSSQEEIFRRKQLAEEERSIGEISPFGYLYFIVFL